MRAQGELRRHRRAGRVGAAVLAAMLGAVSLAATAPAATHPAADGCLGGPAAESEPGRLVGSLGEGAPLGLSKRAV